MENYTAKIRSTFEMGSIHDAESLFAICIQNAFPTNSFRRLELIRFLRDEKYMEGRSLNHVFEIRAGTKNGSPIWEVTCRRVTSGRSPDKNVYLDFESLGFVGYIE